MSETKPPIGIMPKWRWLELRAEELLRAIHDYMQAYAYSAESPVNGWQEELDWIYETLKGEVME